MDVVLKDISIEAAEKGKDYSQKLLDKAVSRGKMDQAKADEVLARITPTADYADLAGCDFVVEAVFEKVSLKHDVFAEVEKVVDADALLGSNTSTLPITSLAEGVSRRKDFIGLHFFSPVDKMPLLEIIRGDETSDEALARALDYAAAIKKTPIVVNDSRGFFTSRVIGTFVNEALAMLGEGIAPSSVEQATTQAGYPVGALQLADELNLELFLKIRNETREAMGDAYRRHPPPRTSSRRWSSWAVRVGLAGKGFFDYDEAGKRKGPLVRPRRDVPGPGRPRRRRHPRARRADARHRGRRIGPLLRRERADHHGRRQHRVDHGHRLPAVDGWRAAVHQRLRGFDGPRRRRVRPARPEQFAKAFGPRFEPNELLRSKAEKSETF